MFTEEEKKHLLDTLDSLQRELVVISPQFAILAANEYSKQACKGNLTGEICYEKYYDRKYPCPGCPVHKGTDSGRMQKWEENLEDVNFEDGVVCYPVASGDKLQYVLRLDFDLSRVGRLEKKLQRSNAFLHNLLLSSVDAVIAADKKGNILIFNDAAYEILDYTTQEALNKLEIRDLYPDGRARDVMKKLRSQEYGGAGKLKAYEVELVSKHGERIPVSLNASIIYEDAAEVATIGFFHDLRETQKMEQELEDTRMQLVQADKMAALGKLAAGVAHQINNPLGGIGLFAQLLLEEHDLSEEAKKDVQRILEDTQRCSDTVKELLEFAKQSAYKSSPQDINKALDRTLFLLEKQALFQNVEVEKELDPDLPYVPCDLQQMSHVFMNLVLNAIQAMQGEGRLKVRSTICDQQKVRIEFMDSGPGIPEYVLPNIFLPFYTTKDAGEGTGLGLSVAYRIVENHGGKISACNLNQGGACFVVELPYGGND
ncbi:MAG: two-component system sensor histidine kinase NtrB [Thermodesulfobacteriota bacterium]